MRAKAEFFVRTGGYMMIHPVVVVFTKFLLWADFFLRIEKQPRSAMPLPPCQSSGKEGDLDG